MHGSAVSDSYVYTRKAVRVANINNYIELYIGKLRGLDDSE